VLERSSSRKWYAFRPDNSVHSAPDVSTPLLSAMPIVLGLALKESGNIHRSRAVSTQYFSLFLSLSFEAAPTFLVRMSLHTRAANTNTMTAYSSNASVSFTTRSASEKYAVLWMRERFSLCRTTAVSSETSLSTAVYQRYKQNHSRGGWFDTV
jgi:hypothetical protein